MTLPTNKQYDDTVSASEFNEAFTAANKVTDQTLVSADISDFDASVSANTTVLAKLGNVVDDTTPQLGGGLDINSNNIFVVPSSTSGLIDGNLAMFDGTNWVQADASAEATINGQIGIYDGTNIITKGVYVTSSLTSGSIYYASETAGAITSTVPTTSLSIVRIIGYALSTTELWVNPDNTYVENA